MKKIILSGCNGKMGRVIAKCVADRQDCEIVAGIDINTEEKDGFPVFASPFEISVEADVLIDFSHPSALPLLLKYAESRKLPVVMATTGLSEEQIASITALASHIPVFYSANMSIGISLLTELARKATAVLSDSFDIEIIEMHHNQKLDAPSGTALMLADAISSVMEEKPHYQFDRHSQRKKREKNEIGMHTVRGGTIVGEHEILFAGRDEIIKLSHTAMSKEIFAVGAINAAIFLASDKSAGLYNMKNLVDAV